MVRKVQKEHYFLLMVKLGLVQVVEDKSWRRTSIFSTRVMCRGKPFTLIIVSQNESQELINKLCLTVEVHQKP